MQSTPSSIELFIKWNRLGVKDGVASVKGGMRLAFGETVEFILEVDSLILKHCKKAFWLRSAWIEMYLESNALLKKMFFYSIVWFYLHSCTSHTSALVCWRHAQKSCLRFIPNIYLFIFSLLPQYEWHLKTFLFCFFFLPKATQCKSCPLTRRGSFLNTVFFSVCDGFYGSADKLHPLPPLTQLKLLPLNLLFKT